MAFLRTFAQHNIKIGNANFGFVHIPKNASTTVKTYMLDAAGYDWKKSPARDWDLDEKNKRVSKKWWNEVTNKDEADIVFTVIRDPVERFISGYTNRVLHYKKMPYCTFDEFVEDAPYWNCPDIDYHLAPQSHYIGIDKKAFHKVFSVNQVDTELKGLLEKFSNKRIKKMRRQSGGHELQKEIVPTALQLKKIKLIYDIDYMYWWNKEIVPEEFK